MKFSLSVKNLLLKHIEQMEQHKEDFVKRPFRDFSRNTKLSFQNTIMSLISMERSSITSELQKFLISLLTHPHHLLLFNSGINCCLLLFSIFLCIFQGVSIRQYNGFNIFAVDGSDILIPLEKENKAYSYFHRKVQQNYHQIHLNAVYNLMNNQYVAAYIEPRKWHNERNAFHHLLMNIHLPLILFSYSTEDMKDTLLWLILPVKDSFFLYVQRTEIQVVY